MENLPEQSLKKFKPVFYVGLTLVIAGFLGLLILFAAIGAVALFAWPYVAAVVVPGLILMGIGFMKRTLESPNGHVSNQSGLWLIFIVFAIAGLAIYLNRA